MVNEDSEEIDPARASAELQTGVEAVLRILGCRHDVQVLSEDAEVVSEVVQRHFKRLNRKSLREYLLVLKDDASESDKLFQELLVRINARLREINADFHQQVVQHEPISSEMHQLLANAQIGMLLLDTDLAICRFTPEIAPLYQLLPGDVGTSIEGYTRHLVCENLILQMRRCLEGGDAYEALASDRSGNPYLIRLAARRDGAAIAGVVLTLINIATVEGADTETQKFRRMAESSTDPMLLINSRGGFEYANLVAARTLQYSRDRLQQMTVFDIDTQFDESRYRDVFDTAAESVLPPFESEWRRKDGSCLPVEISVSRVDVAGRRWLYANIRDITERQQAEFNMRLQTLAMDAATGGIIICDALQHDMPITYANAAFYKMTGYSSEEVLGCNCRFLQGEGTDPESVQRIREAIRDEQPCRVTLRNYRKDGTEFWNDLQISPVFDAGGHLRNYVGILHDITGQVRQREMSRTEARRITAIINSTAEGMYGVDGAGNCTFANTACIELLGYSREEDLIGQHMHSLIHNRQADGSHRPVADCDIYQAMPTGVGTHVEGDVFRRKNGTLFPVEYRSEPLCQDDEIIGCVVSFQDISERLALASQLEQMGAMVDASNDAIVIWELDGAIVRWNTGATRLYGYEAHDVIGKVTHALFRTRHPGEWDEVRDTLLKSGEWVGVLEQETAVGEPITVFSRHQLITLSDGRQYVLEINRDFSEQAQANEALEQANEAKSRFLANISHELRTPMTAVLGFAEMLKGQSADPEYQEKIETILRNGNFLLALLNDILDLSKIEAGKMLIKSESVSVPQLIQDIRVLMESRAADEGVPLTFEFLTDVPSFVTGDRIRIRQVLVNLIGNALKFTDKGQVRILTDVQRTNGENWLRIQVADTGIGMTPEQLEGLFQPFTQATADTSREYGGTGLGLSISKRLAEAMGGRVSVESVFGQGSVFTVWMPISNPQLESVGRPQFREDTALVADKADHSMPPLHARILLADDRRDVWRVARYFLEKCGAEVEVAEDGRQAVDAVNRAASAGRPFDLILMDMQMPVMTGQEAVAELRSQGLRIPIIALTADAMSGERESCLAFGCDAYAPKPINGPELMQMVSRLLRSRT